MVGGANLYLGILSLKDESIKIDCMIEAIIIFIFAYKIQNKSRVAAVIMLIYYSLGRLFSLLELIGVLGQAQTNFGVRLPIVEVPLFLIISIVLIGCFVEGVRGTFAYHRLVELQNPSSSQR
jgi:hypothetical protein